MDEKFLEAVKTYLSIVEEACNTLIDYIEKEYNTTILSKYDLYDYLFRSHRYEFIIEERKYFQHGLGFTIYENDKPIIEWDFGYRSWWCGIQPFKMSNTLKNFGYKESDYCNTEFIKQECEQYVIDNFMYYYKGQYYINLLKLESKKIEFPTEYDRVVVEYKGVTKSFFRDKRMDKFIRKSNAIYARISEMNNNYILIFYNNDMEVARIPYNDIAYPDSAVKIMNQEIIRPHITDV